MARSRALARVAASLLTTICHMLKDSTHFQDLGADDFDLRSKELKAIRLIAQLAEFGFNAELTPSPKLPEMKTDIASKTGAMHVARPGRGPCSPQPVSMVSPLCIEALLGPSETNPRILHMRCPDIR
jgi:hypothetical protein